MKDLRHLKRFNESNENEITDSLRRLVKNILTDSKLDVDSIEEGDPEFIDYIADMILRWHNANK